MSGAPERRPPSRFPAVLDASRPSIARVYDGFLGGKEHYEADREVMRHVLGAVPDAAELVCANRAFLTRACRFLATETKIEQYLDCGAGLPTEENTHQIVQRANPDARVIYVDDDPVVLAQGRALLEENENVHVIEADIFTPSAVLRHEVVLRHLDFGEPVALLHVGTLPQLAGDGGPEIMREYLDALAPGSYVVLSHFYDPEVPELTEVARRFENALVSGPLGAGWFRTRDEITALVRGLEIVRPNATSEPDLVPCDEWWPDGPRLAPPGKAARCVAGLVARKP
ncbi:SAM-dependent methyltransferase [Amycolatopsis cynarae]|uniref:SAM-dependent methyltransferase n=1 Tax=Amycolatopsis cynarae TaxID=2995223 RepID=A0ABY7BDV1_9PSEU|nr:SAM-dependent methyltransferase [Amycolatopsis sp. HUAS 11-8]WAL69813.1 SAM-dependent methyltransferase [Amycolatopsis sp. HUAS 11-8]